MSIMAGVEEKRLLKTLFGEHFDPSSLQEPPIYIPELVTYKAPIRPKEEVVVSVEEPDPLRPVDPRVAERMQRVWDLDTAHKIRLPLISGGSKIHYFQRPEFRRALNYSTHPENRYTAQSNFRKLVTSGLIQPFDPVERNGHAEPIDKYGIGAFVALRAALVLMRTTNRYDLVHAAKDALGPQNPIAARIDPTGRYSPSA